MKKLRMSFSTALIVAAIVSISNAANASELSIAVEKNDHPVVTRLLNSGVDINAKDPQGLTPLMIASGLGNPQMVQLLLTAGADPFILDSRMGASALHKAAQSGVVDVAKLLLEHGAFIDLQSPNMGHTPLHDAVWHKKKELVKFLVEQGADLSIRNNRGKTALDLARRDKLDLIIVVLENGEKRRVEAISINKLAIAAQKGDLPAVKQLIVNGDDVNARLPMTGTPFDGHTPLLIASLLGYTEIVEELLKAGANPRLVDGIIKATSGHKSGYQGHPGVLKLLCRQGLEIDAQGPYNGYTALHDAVWHGHTDAAKVLIDAGARLDLHGHDGRTPLDVAAQDGYADALALLEAAAKKRASAGANK